MTITTDGQTVIPMPAQTTDLSTVRLFVNGVEYGPPNIAAAALSVTWLNPNFILEQTDAVELEYA